MLETIIPSLIGTAIGAVIAYAIIKNRKSGR